MRSLGIWTDLLDASQLFWIAGWVHTPNGKGDSLGYFVLSSPGEQKIRSL